MKTIRDIDLKDKTVLLRADYNVPVVDGKITDDYRITRSLPTLQFLLDHGCKVIIISHLGRPGGKPDGRYSLFPVASRLSELMGRTIHFIDRDVKKAADSLKTGDVALLENLRFRPEEEANDGRFAHDLAHLAGVFVQDGFGVVHRAHASTDAITKFIPGVAGLLLEREVKTITTALESPKRPLVAVIGGAKVSDKIELIERFVEKADRLVIGGAMANTFLAGKPLEFDMGKSRLENDLDEQLNNIWHSIYAKLNLQTGSPAKDRYRQVERFLLLPTRDVAVAVRVDESEKRREVATGNVGKDDMALDFGRASTQAAIETVKQAGTVIWNGPLGVTELPAFAKASQELARAIIESEAYSLVGGGDTAAFVEQQGLVDKFDWVSTGGGAALDLMAGKTLPGIAALNRETSHKN